ncbi:MAG: acyl-CoA dehydrogenase family protein [Phycisphaeraceae bacterium]
MVRLQQQDRQEFERARDLIEPGPGQEAGFVRSLFFGRLHFDRLLPYPQQDPDEAARTDALLARLDAFLEETVDADLIDAEQRIGHRVIDGLARLGVLGMTVPPSHGGGGFSHTAYCRVLERISRTCASTAVMVGAHQSIGLKALVLNGTESQKRRWLPDLASGKMLSAFCLSEPEVGSDAANIQTQATLSPDGEHWILNGQKRYATNAALAGFMTVMARTVGDTGERAADGKPKGGVTAFIVTPDLPGFEVVSRNRSKCGVRGSWQATLRFTDMPVPRDQVLGEVGRGLKVALTVLDYGRCTMSAGCVGAARVALDKAVEHARHRRQFNRSIGEFHLVKEKIARMAEAVYAMDAMTYLTAGLVDRHEGDIMLESAAAKLYCSEAAWSVIDDAVQIWGGEGYMREHGLERMLRDARINRIVEGTTEVMTAFIALMGMKNVGEQFEQTLNDMRHPLNNLGRLGTFMRQEWRDVVVGHGRASAIDTLRPVLRGDGRRLAQLTRRLARCVGRVLATHREGVVQQQLIQQRLAWSAVELYAMAAVLARLQATLESAGDAHGNGDAGVPAGGDRDLVVGLGFCRSAAARIERRLDTLFANDDANTLAVADAVLDDAAAQPTQPTQQNAHSDGPSG